MTATGSSAKRTCNKCGSEFKPMFVTDWVCEMCNKGFGENTIGPKLGHEVVMTYDPALVAQVDVVNHPPHYTQGGIECIDYIESVLTPEEFAGYCKGNAIKYTHRERHKGGTESLEKAVWYLNRLINARSKKCE